MEVPLITRQYGFNYSDDFIHEQVVNELEEVNLDGEITYKSVPVLTKAKSEKIVYRSVPVLTKAKSEEYNKNCIKVTRSYSY